MLGHAKRLIVGFLLSGRTACPFLGFTRRSTCSNSLDGRLVDHPVHRPRAFSSSNVPTAALRAGDRDKISTEEYKIQNQKFLERMKRWVVIVDDEEAIRLAVGDYLYDQGYQVTACADADALLEVCAKPKSDGELPSVPDLIVSDIRMPGKDGLELLGLLRADERLERVPVVLLTAKALTQDRIEGYRAGADAYLPKPFNPEELLTIIDNSIMRRKQMTGENGKFVDLKTDLSNIKQILRQNGKNLVKATKVYLTPSEREVLGLLCKGFTNGEIASERGVNVIGVNRMIQTMYLKTQTRTRTELVRWAIQTGHVAAR